MSTVVEMFVGHMPPKMNTSQSLAFAPTRLEKENPEARKSAPGKSDAVISFETLGVP